MQLDWLKRVASDCIEEKLNRDGGWCLSRELFGDIGADFHDFEIENYIYFLDNVSSLEDLGRGLKELSPFADDALSVAEKMTEKDFKLFKLKLKSERTQQYESSVPNKFINLLIPSRFLQASFIAKSFNVCLGVMLIRIAQTEP